MKSTLLKILVVAFLVGLVIYLLASGQKPIKEGQHEISVAGNKVFVEIMDTDAKRAMGLSGRSSLSQKEGMLFVFEEKDIMPAFWMKNMQFAIDIIWINDGKVVQVDKNIPAPSPQTPDSQLVLYKPEESIDYVLEVASGFSEKNKVVVGSEISLPSGY